MNGLAMCGPGSFARLVIVLLAWRRTGTSQTVLKTYQPQLDVSGAQELLCADSALDFLEYPCFIRIFLCNHTYGCWSLTNCDLHLY